MTKQELIEQVREVARRLGKTTLKHKDFRAESKVADHWIRRYFDGWPELCAAAGIAPERAHRLRDDEIFAAMLAAFEAFGGIGTRYQLARHFRYDCGVLNVRWPDWVAALAAFREWVLVHVPGWPLLEELELRIAHGVSPGPRSGRAAGPWIGSGMPAEAPSATAPVEDPVALARPLPGADARAHALSEETPRAAPGENPDTVPGSPVGPLVGPMVGDVIAYRGMVFAPTNEVGVVMLFAAAALELGFAVEAVKAGFPDCYAWRRVGQGRWRRVRIEFEYASANFRIHEHDPRGCDLIVCWEHNWHKCSVEVFDLKREIARLRLKGLGLA
jgi:hypothetical protein